MRTTRRWLVALVPALALLASCTSTGAPDGTPSLGRGTVSVTVDGRPFPLHVPASYHAGSPVPLVVALHGYTSDAAGIESYFKLTAQSDARGFLYATPEGVRDRHGERYWDATDACCDFDRSGVDDSAYLSHLIDAVRRSYSVDRVFLVGHSNGAFMAMRMACDHADQLTAIVGLNGATWADKSRCRPSRPVSVLDIRSNADGTISYEGGVQGADGHTPYPSAATTDADWRDYDRCDPAAKQGAALDLVTDLAGADTEVTSWACAANTTVEAWQIMGGSHSPNLSGAFAPALVDFLYAQATT